MVNNILSIDVEEIFHIEYTRHAKKCNFDYRTPNNIPAILDLLREKNVTATFFIVGELAEKFTEVLRVIEEEGHEVAFHGWSHLPLWKLNPKLYRQEVVRFKRIHSSCIGYRAPSFSLNNKTKWMLKILHEEGFRYDSSIFPTWTPLYGVYSAPLKPYIPSLTDISKEGNENFGILEFPLAVYNFLVFKIPIAGGFWPRLWNIGFVKRGIRKLNQSGNPAVIFVHNWELDPELSRLRLNFYKSFVTYHNVEKTLERFRSLLNQFQFTSFADYMKAMGTI